MWVYDSFNAKLVGVLSFLNTVAPGYEGKGFMTVFRECCFIIFGSIVTCKPNMIKHFPSHGSVTLCTHPATWHPKHSQTSEFWNQTVSFRSPRNSYHGVVRLRWRSVPGRDSMTLLGAQQRDFDNRTEDDKSITQGHITFCYIAYT